jgi:plastocyanin
MSYYSTRRARRHLKIASMAVLRLQLLRFASAVGVVAFLSAASAGGQSVQSQKSAQHVVIIKQMHFDPPQMTIQTGETVEWKNEDIFSHTVTADDGSFDSGLIAPGGSWQMTIKTAGKFGYHCRPHPNMTATLIVQAAAGQQVTCSNAAAPGGNKMLPRSNGRRRQRRSTFIPSL